MLKYALDIGSYSIRLLAVEPKDLSLEIKGASSYATEGYFGGVITDSRKLFFSILEVLTEFSKKYGQKPKRILINYSSPKIKFYHLKQGFRRDQDKPITIKELQRYKSQVLNENIPLDEKTIYMQVLEYKIDEQRGVVNPNTMLAKELEVFLNVVTMPLTVYNNICSLISEVGMEVEDIIPEVIAKANLLLSEEEMTSGIMLLDIGWGVTKVVVFKNGILKGIKGFESNLKSISDLLQSVYHLSPLEAEELWRESLVTESDKLHIHTKTDLKNVSVENIRNITQKRLEKILYLVRKFIIEERLSHHLCQGVVITDNDFFKFPDLSNIAYDVLRQPIRIARSDILKTGQEYATAFGMLKYSFMQQLKETHQKSNIIKKIFSGFIDTLKRYF